MGCTSIYNRFFPNMFKTHQIQSTDSFSWDFCFIENSGTEGHVDVSKNSGFPPNSSIKK